MKTLKTLQNNFTTPEQSKRLLDLGVPADSTDFFYDLEANNPPHANQIPWFLDVAYSELSDEFRLRALLPCWSVGRLIEILKICVFDKDALAEIFEELRDCVDETKSLIKIFDEYSDVLDFSKLEE